MNIGALTETTSNSIRGIGGLASGLDRDTMIEGMSANTIARIEKQKSQKTTVQWKQESIRAITDKLISFADKYTSTYSSSSNLFSSSFWGRTQITALGNNSKYVSVSGSANTADTISIQSVTQLAKKAQYTSSKVSSGVLKTGEIDLEEVQKASNLEGKTLQFTYGDKDYTITLPTGIDKAEAEGGQDFTYDYSTLEKAAESINHALSKEVVGSDKKLSQVVKVTADTVNNKLTFESAEDPSVGNLIKLKGGTALKHLGFNDENGNFTEVTLAGGDGAGPATSKVAITDKDLFTETQFIDRISGKNLTFNYNGLSKAITLPTADELKDIDGKLLEGEALRNKLVTSMQSELDKAFGTGRITVGFDLADPKTSQTKGSFVFNTTTPDGKEDSSSILSLTSSDAGIAGTGGAFNVEFGASNRVNLSSKVGTGFEFNINGTKIVVTDTDTINDVLDRINKETNVEVKYQASTDKFTFTSKEDGASGKINITAEGDNVARLKSMFGIDLASGAVDVKGQDAIMKVKHAGSGEVQEIVRGTNTIKMDGLTINVKGTFESKDPGDEITFDAKVDSDKIFNTVKDMVKEFNEIIDLVNKSVRTKPNRDYKPLTEAQKKEMTKSEIEAWEEKAKEGLLFNDNDIKGLSNGLRFVLGSGDLQALEKIGITVSSTASDNGKLNLDEAKFKAALESDPEGIRKLFTKEVKKDEAGNVIQSGGIATNMRNVLDKYAKTIGEPKGILIRRAGSVKSPASVLRNEMQKQIDEFDKQITLLEATLKREQDRYIRDFTTLETLIAQMNSQSNALAQFYQGY